MGLIVFHGTRKRRCFSVDFVFAHAGVPGGVAHSSAGIMEDRRRLVVGRGCGGIGVGFDGILLGLQEKEIPLRLKSHRQKHGEQRVRRALLLTNSYTAHHENIERFRDYLETFSPVCPKDSADMPLLAPVVREEGQKTS